mgnify:CR=1 FL=1
MKKQNRLLSLILSLFLLLFTLVPQSALTVKAEGNSEMAVHFIDVGQGNAILVQFRRTKSFVRWRGSEPC